jgi:hypothetical protein
MAIQSTNSLMPRLASISLVATAQRAVTDFLVSQAHLSSTDKVTDSQARANGFLRSRIASLSAQASISQVEMARMDVARSALEQVEQELLSLSGLIGSIVTPAGNALDQAQVKSVVSSIQSVLGTALKNNPALMAPVALPSQANSRRVEDIVIDKITVPIDAEGKLFRLWFTQSGRQAVIANALTPGGATFANDVSFIVSGPSGSSGVINLTGGVSTAADAINAINALTSSTGVEAIVNGANVNLRAVDFGVKTITILDVSANGDPGNEVASTNQTTAGLNAVAVLRDMDAEEQITITGEGRTIRFNFGGVQGTIDLVKDISIWGSGAFGGNNANSNFRVFSGGVPIVGDGGTLIARQSIPAFNIATLGRSLGGLASIDVINNKDQALDIVTRALTDLSKSQTVAEFLSGNFLPSKVNSSASALLEAQANIANLDNFFDATVLFGRVQAEARSNASLAVLSQLSGLFPASTLGLI